MLPPGTLIGNRYRVERLLGQGGMSNIYVCRDTRLGGPPHAVKEMTARYSNPEEQAAALRHFEREARLLARLKHPSLPTVTDYFEFQGHYYLVMEYVQGEDLGRMLARTGGPLPERQVAEWGAEIATVLYYLHRQQPEPIIFRDVKPSNIMLVGPKVKLIDFGIARHFNPNKKGDTMRIGSPGYAPPEQYSGQTDPRSDIYALGVTLHQALSGRDPTQTQTPFQLPPVRSLNPAVSEEMARIIARATQMLPENRYQDMLEMKRDLKALVTTHRGGTAVVHSPPEAQAQKGGSAAGPTQPGTQARKGGTAAVQAPPSGLAPSTVQPPGPSVPHARRRRLSCSGMAAVLLILVGAGLGLALVANPTNLSRLQAMVEGWFPASQQAATGGEQLYLEGAPLAEALRALSGELERTPDSGATWIYWNNALAGLPARPVLTLGVIIPQGPQGDALLRGVALGQRAINGLGGVQEKAVVIVLERPDPDQVGRAARQVAEGRSGRRLEGQDAAGQSVEAVLVFAGVEAQARIPSLPVPTFLVCDSPDQAASEPAGVLADPGLEGAARALVGLAGERALVVFNPELSRLLQARGAKVVPATGVSAAGVGDLVQKNPRALFALSTEAADRATWEALLRAGGEVVLVAAGAEDLPKVPREFTGRMSAVVALSPFHHWRDGAAACRLGPATFGARPPGPATARAYDAVRWLASSVLAEDGEYRGATLAAARDGKVRPAPYQLFDFGPGGWRYRRSLEAAES